MAWSTNSSFNVCVTTTLIGLRSNGSRGKLFCSDARFVETIMLVNPRWCPLRGVLMVAAAVQSMAGGPKLIKDVMLYFFKWSKFTITRWASVKRSAIAWVASLQVGLDGVWDMCKADPTIQKYHLNGFLRGRAMLVRRLALTACFSGMVGESSAERLLHDDRFLRVAPELWDQMKQELHFVATDVQEITWGWLAAIVPDNFDGFQARQCAMWSSLATMAYNFKDSFEQLERYPLKLTQGNLETNVIDLLAVPFDELVEPFSRDMRVALETGSAVSEMVDALELAKDTASSTNLVEQGHGSGATTLLAHDQLSKKMLQAFSTVHQARAQFRPDPEVAKLAELEAKLTQKKRVMETSTLSAKQWLLRLMVRGKYGDRPAHMDKREWSVDCLHRHHGVLQGLSHDEKQQLEEDAEVGTRIRTDALAEEIEELKWVKEQTIAALASESAGVGVANKVSSFRLTPADKKRVAEHMQNVFDEFVGRELHKAFTASAPSLPDETLQELYTASGVTSRASRRIPAKTLLCKYRQEFYGSAVFSTASLTGAVPGVIFMPLTMVQNPLDIVWLRLQKLPRVLPAEFGSMDGDGLDLHRLSVPRFSIMPLTFTLDDGFMERPDEELWVLPDLEFSEGYDVIAPLPALTLRHFSSGMEVTKETKATAPRAKPRVLKTLKQRVKKRLLDEFPWLSPKDLDTSDEEEEVDGSSMDDSAPVVLAKFPLPDRFVSRCNFACFCTGPSAPAAARQRKVQTKTARAVRLVSAGEKTLLSGTDQTHGLRASLPKCLGSWLSKHRPSALQTAWSSMRQSSRPQSSSCCLSVLSSRRPRVSGTSTRF